jgi:hypothetical protein
VDSIGDERAVDGFGELSFERAERFGAAAPCRQPTLVVVAAGAGEDRLHACGEMDRVVELSVSAARQAMTDDIAADASIGAVPA